MVDSMASVKRLESISYPVESIPQLLLMRSGTRDMVPDLRPDLVPSIISDLIPDRLPDLMPDPIPYLVPDPVAVLVADLVPNLSQIWCQHGLVTTKKKNKEYRTQPNRLYGTNQILKILSRVS